MKSLQTILLILLSLMLVFAGGCKDDKKNPTGPDSSDPGANTMTATISGAVTLSFVASNAGGVTNNNEFTIHGTMVVGNTTYMLNVIVWAKPTTGTFGVVDPATSNAAGKASSFFQLVDGTGQRTFWGYTGTVTVTSAGTRFKGSFSLTAFEDAIGGIEINITNGCFDVLNATTL